MVDRFGASIRRTPWCAWFVPLSGCDAGAGGPHIQYVTNSWRMTVDMRAQNLSRQGFVVLKARPLCLHYVPLIQ
jgi:hypothetical protein